MVTIDILNFFIDIIAVFLLGIVIAATLMDKKRSIESRFFLLTCSVAAIHCLSDLGCTVLSMVTFHFVWAQRVFMYIYFISLFPVLSLASIYLFHVLKIREDIRKKLVAVVQIGFDIWIIMCVALFFTNGLFYIDNAGNYSAGDNIDIVYVYAGAFMLANAFVALFSEKSQPRQRITLALISVAPILVYTISINGSLRGVTITSIAIIILIMLLYTNTYVERNKSYYKSEMELQDKRMEVMLSQIQPHFLYNSISSAVSLCRTDPEKAAETMQNFGKYLRGNLDALKVKTPIPFSDELKHIKAYVQLEQTRFGEMLNVEYNIGVKDFVVPPLSVQPLVENAIKHGISESGKSGTVIITTWQDKDNIYIKISDNGQGFDTSILSSEESVHIGINSVRSRIENMVSGTFLIESTPKKGTTSLITIPIKL